MNGELRRGALTVEEFLQQGATLFNPRRGQHLPEVQQQDEVK